MGSLEKPSTGDKEFTFGVEVEVHVAALLLGAKDPNGEDQRKLHQVSRDVLTNRELYSDELENIMRAVEACLRRENINIQRVDVEHPLPNKPEDSPGTNGGKTAGSLLTNGYEVYQEWTVCFNESGYAYSPENKKPRPTAPEEYVWFPLEFKSPVRNDFDTLRRELSQITTAIRQSFRVSVKCGRGDGRTGMHVHVGIRKKLTELQKEPAEATEPPVEFELSTMKRLLTLAWLYEPAIMSLHASWKSDYPRYCSLLRQHSHLAGLHGIRLNPSNYPPSENKKLKLEDFTEVAAMEAQRKENVGGDRDQDPALKIIWAARNMEHLAWLAASQFGERRPALSLRK